LARKHGRRGLSGSTGFAVIVASAAVSIPTAPTYLVEPVRWQSSSGRYCRARGAIKLRGKRSQAQANHTEADQSAKIWDEPSDGEDQ